MGYEKKYYVRIPTRSIGVASHPIIVKGRESVGRSSI